MKSDFCGTVQPPKIICDSRELRSGVVKGLERIGAEVEIRTLEVGDYVVSEKVGFERKAMEDFFNSLFVDRKLFSQLIDLAETFEKPILILEGGDPFCSGRQIRPEAIQGMINTIALLRVPTIYTLNEAETAQVLFQIAKKEQEDKRRPITIQLHGKRSHFTDSEIKEYVISAIPEIGRATAIGLLRHFGSIQAIVNAETGELQECYGIGEKTAEKIKEVVGGQYGR